NKWKEIFNIGIGPDGKAKRRTRMTAEKFAETVREQTEKVFKQKAHQCPSCKGSGKYHKLKQDGTPYAKAFNCLQCAGEGIIYENLKEYAGLKISPKNFEQTTAHGFATDKETLDAYSKAVRNPVAREFLTS